jgi:hypothetical protein
MTNHGNGEHKTGPPPRRGWQKVVPTEGLGEPKRARCIVPLQTGDTCNSATLTGCAQIDSRLLYEGGPGGVRARPFPSTKNLRKCQCGKLYVVQEQKKEDEKVGGRSLRHYLTPPLPLACRNLRKSCPPEQVAVAAGRAATFLHAGDAIRRLGRRPV